MIRGENTTSNYTLRTEAITLIQFYSQIGSNEKENYSRVTKKGTAVARH